MASNMDKMNKLSWNHRGLCFNAIGQPIDVDNLFFLKLLHLLTPKIKIIKIRL